MVTYYRKLTESDGLLNCVIANDVEWPLEVSFSAINSFTLCILKILHIGL